MDALFFLTTSSISDKTEKIFSLSFQIPSGIKKEQVPINIGGVARFGGGVIIAFVLQFIAYL